jgi:serine/threonine protein kinase
MDVFPGAVIAERYMANRKVGMGAFGEVWEATHLAIGVKVAIKTLLPAAKSDADAITRLRREAYFLARIQSDRVARVLDFISDDTFGLVLVIEFVEGELLFDVLRSRKQISVEEALEIGEDILTGLCDFHAADVIHRDLKPGNIIMRPLLDGRFRAMIFDFSLSRQMAKKDATEDSITNLTKSNVAVGTLEYMAPEQVLNSRQVTERSDLYSVGAILYRAVAGKHPFPGTNVELAQTKLMTEAPAIRTGRDDRVALDFEAFVMKALRRKPSQRFSTALEMLHELRLMLSVVRAKSAPLVDDEVTRIAPNPTLALAAADKRAAEDAYEAETAVEAHPITHPITEPLVPITGLDLPEALPQISPAPPTSRLLVAAAMIGTLAGGIMLGGFLSENNRRDFPAAVVAPPVIFVDAAVALPAIPEPSTLAGDAGDAGDDAHIADANVPERVVPKPIVRVVRPPPVVEPDSSTRPTRLSAADADAPPP